MATTSAGDAPSEELLALDAREPRRLSSRGRARSCATGEHAIVQASLLVQEDLCVLVRDRAVGLASGVRLLPVAMESREQNWHVARRDSLAGTGLRGGTRRTHERVLRSTQSGPIVLATELDPARRSGIAPTDPFVSTPTDPSSEWYFRVERQTLRKLPETGAVVFTIRTYVASLRRDDGATIPISSNNLLVSLDSAPPATRPTRDGRASPIRLRVALGEGSTNA